VDAASFKENFTCSDLQGIDPGLLTSFFFAL